MCGLNSPAANKNNPMKFIPKRNHTKAHARVPAHTDRVRPSCVLELTAIGKGDKMPRAVDIGRDGAAV